MPTGYFSGQGKTYSRKLGKWLTKQTEKAFDYEDGDQEGAAFLLSFFRWYPDYYADLIRDKNAKYGLELPQRLMMRIFARYRNTYITGVRGLTKTYILLLTKMIDGVLFPGKNMRYVAPNQKQAASLATQAYHEIEKSYPLLTRMWQLRNDRTDMFRITTIYGSEFTMYATRGSNMDEICCEEAGQEGEDGFPIDDVVTNLYPAVRGERQVNQHKDRVCINEKHTHIGNACSKQNKAYTELRQNCLKDMIHSEDRYEGFVADFSWITALLSNIRGINYFKDLKKTLTPEKWLRECCARYIGTGVDPLIPDDVLARSRKLKVMEKEHCEDPSVIYIVSHDVSYVDGQNNAKCADVVLKLTPYEQISKRDKYRKQAVFVDAYPPPKTSYLQAQKLRELWSRYCADDCQATYLVVDAQAYGTEVVEELMKPSNDGLPNLCCYNHMRFTEIEQPNALPIIYPLKATTKGGTDADGDMIRYMQQEFTQGNVELLVANALDGIEAYKNEHGIKDDMGDVKIIAPYRMTDELCQQIQNLQTVVSGVSTKEKRKSVSIQRDIHSALKYSLRMAQILEGTLKNEKYKARSSWSEVIQSHTQGKSSYVPSYKGNVRSNLLSMRRR